MTEYNRSIVYGLLWIVGLFLFAFYFGSNPLSRLALVLNSRTTQGAVMDASYDEHDDSEGNPQESHYAEYTYSVNGKTYKGTTSADFTELFSPDDDMPIATEIEYVPEYPSISRIKGLGSQTFWDWLWSTLLQLVFVFLFALPGIAMLRDGFERRKKYLQTIAEQSVSVSEL